MTTTTKLKYEKEAYSIIKTKHLTRAKHFKTSPLNYNTGRLPAATYTTESCKRLEYCSRYLKTRFNFVRLSGLTHTSPELT